MNKWCLVVFSILMICPERSFSEEAKPEVLYANDLGSATIDASNYPRKYQKTFKMAFQKCAKCHSLSRPLNSQFLELSKKEIEVLKKENPDIFEKNNILMIESAIWKRYVQRMMAKPGCDINSKDGKAIWQFLVFDSKHRKSGKNMKEWVRHRRELLREFKEKHPQRYEMLYSGN